MFFLRFQSAKLDPIQDVLNFFNVNYSCSISENTGATAVWRQKKKLERDFEFLLQFYYCTSQARSGHRRCHIVFVVVFIDTPAPIATMLTTIRLW